MRNVFRLKWIDMLTERNLDVFRSTRCVCCETPVVQQQCETTLSVLLVDTSVTHLLCSIVLSSFPTWIYCLISLVTSFLCVYLSLDDTLTVYIYMNIQPNTLWSMTHMPLCMQMTHMLCMQMTHMLCICRKSRQTYGTHKTICIVSLEIEPPARLVYPRYLSHHRHAGILFVIT